MIGRYSLLWYYVNKLTFTTVWVWVLHIYFGEIKVRGNLRVVFLFFLLREIEHYIEI